MWGIDQKIINVLSQLVIDIPNHSMVDNQDIPRPRDVTNQHGEAETSILPDL